MRYRRFSKSCLVLIAVIFLLPALLGSRRDLGPAAAGEPTVWGAAQEIRELLGLSMSDYIPALLDDQAYQQMAEAGIDFVEQDEQHWKDVVRTFRQERNNLGYRVNRFVRKKLDDPQYEVFEQARGVLVVAGGALRTALVALVPEEHAHLLPRLVANVGLDEDLRVLQLTGEQRTQIIAAQRERYLDLQRIRPPSTENLAEVMQTFENTLAEILTPEQLQERANIRQTIDSRTVAISQIEMALREE
jgi:hypothetical protein